MNASANNDNYDYEKALALQNENGPSQSTSPSQSSIHNDEHERDRDRSLHLWTKSNFNEKYYVKRSKICGTGAFSKVYLGSNIVTSAQVAVKVIDRKALCDEEEERLVAEIEILRDLSHDNILSELRGPHPQRSVLFYALPTLSMLIIDIDGSTSTIPNHSFSFLLRLRHMPMNSYPRCISRGRELSHYPGVHEWRRSAWHYRSGECS